MYQRSYNIYTRNVLSTVNYRCNKLLPLPDEPEYKHNNFKMTVIGKITDIGPVVSSTAHAGLYKNK